MRHDRGACWTPRRRVLYTCADVLATRSPSRWECPRFAQPSRARRRRCRRRAGRSTSADGARRAGLVVGRHDGRREVVKRYRLIAAVGAVAMFTAVLSGSSAYGGSSGSAQGARSSSACSRRSQANFAPWGIQVRAGAALAVNEINRSGGVKGRGQGRQAQPRRRGRPVHEHDRGHRRLQAADAAGERRLGRGHHRQPDRAGDDAARRGGEDSAVPREVGEQRDPDAVEPLHVPHVPARRCHGGSVGRAARAAT